MTHKHENSTCRHENSIITLYEEQSTLYQLVGGVVEDINDDIEAKPIFKTDISCPDCNLSITDPDWTQTPEPLLTYCRSIYQQEYEVPSSSSKHPN
jgi:hypothetical protein